MAFGASPLEASVLLPNWGTRNELIEVVALARAGALEVSVERVRLEDVPPAYERLARGEVTGRVVVLSPMNALRARPGAARQTVDLRGPRPYCRGVDRCDEDLIRSAFHDDSYDDHGYWKGPGHELAPFLADRLRNGELGDDALDHERADRAGRRSRSIRGAGPRHPDQKGVRSGRGGRGRGPVPRSFLAAGGGLADRPPNRGAGLAARPRCGRTPPRRSDRGFRARRAASGRSELRRRAPSWRFAEVSNMRLQDKVIMITGAVPGSATPPRSGPLRRSPTRAPRRRRRSARAVASRDRLRGRERRDPDGDRRRVR